MTITTARNVLFVVFLGAIIAASQVELRASPGGFCNDWECQDCGFTYMQCPARGIPLINGWHMTGCRTGDEGMCTDNEWECFTYCAEDYEDQLAACLDPSWPEYCWIGYAGNSHCENSEGTNDCECEYFNWCFAK